MDWGLYRTFLEIARSGSLSAAARTLGITHPTARRHLEELEQQLGGRLFTRSTRGLLPTGLAERILPEVTRIEASIGAIARLVTERVGSVQGTVRVSASEVMGIEVLPSMLARIRTLHPGLTFELILSDSETDILRRDADLAVRMIRPRQTSLVARRVGTIEVGFYAHRSWLAEHGVPSSREQLLAAPNLIGQDRRRTLADALEIDEARLNQSLVLATDSDVAQIAAVRAALGVGVLQVPLAMREPALVRVLPDLDHKMEVWLVTHPDLKSSALMQAAMAALYAELKSYIRPADGNTPS
ncbi:LysR family transcriptional regulator [Methylocella tundrae]|uniref:LysR family transcriptional regulator n=1 Tax=Methylocella tundrae TaxID=227605 RepID=A0A4U8YZ63_METTU|nr:LysR family transcriptional regulator [Methylocella tundrae]WPP05911.1 LysR family transcriptional regulator [Methylocella tundrae]VFU08455.1 LysR family transcriptional regulator [Methylocella tundrae]